MRTLYRFSLPHAVLTACLLTAGLGAQAQTAAKAPASTQGTPNPATIPGPPCTGCYPEPQLPVCSSITNGDFEKYSQLPTNTTTNNMGGGHYHEGQLPTTCTNWESPTEGRPIYMHTGVTNPFMNPTSPYALVGSATPHSGGGLVLLRNQYLSAHPTYGQVRDYISQAIPTLTAGRQYYAECWATIPTPNQGSGGQSAWINYGFGLSFTNGNPAPCPKWDDIYCQFEYELPAAPTSRVLGGLQIDHQWTRVSGAFTATGNENFLTIGLFSGASLAPNATTGYTGQRVNVFVDDVVVFELPGAVPQSCPTSATSVTLQTTSPSGCQLPGMTYTWYGPNGYYSRGPLNPVVTNYVPGTYTLFIRLPDGTGSTSTTVVPTAPCFIVMPTEPKQATRIEAYPNPANDLLNLVVSGSETEQAQATLYDGQGTPVQELTLQHGKAQMPTQHLRNGIYYLRVVTKQGKRTDQQISIQH
ncbi:T9SS type A sorting domain-containing protein [Microvirga sp. STR05]|uniref:T9SS type A sorting domain-containing protein n=1 Tax=Hymenobacter duratus TaxID=2771356 RepID=A0ABR8JN63_9BACT|nr:T9SS type A sorting domain-containing protein [Hymenobacter duratus]MBD2717320.1 T9SS type A sorting domain-containing protein [Hymenobacter duratus]MBR7952242.1 T9SS type A sorting domain-containing protein [Microvirga sp. STR05]